QYWQRHMQPLVQPTTRTPGPSTVAPVVNECRNPMSPVASAERTSVSVTPRPRLTRNSYGLFASSEGTARWVSGIAVSSMERPVDDVHLLLPRQPHEVDRVARYPNRQARILLGMVHRVDERVAIEHIDVHVIAGAGEERVEHAGEIRD